MFSNIVIILDNAKFTDKGEITLTIENNTDNYNNITQIQILVRA